MMKSMRDQSRRPTHPGAILRYDVLPALNITQSEFARRLGVSRLTISKLLSEKRDMTRDIASCVGKVLCTTPDSWLRMQQAVDLWEIQRKVRLDRLPKSI